MGELLTKKERRQLKKLAREQAKDQQKQQGLYKKIALWLGVLLVLAGAAWGMVALNKNSTRQKKVSIEISDSDHRLGNDQSQVVLVEYSDFQCPACAYYSHLIKDFQRDYLDRVLFVYRYFPLRQIHPQAEPAARVAEAAARQGKFWEMHDLLFENQAEWSNSSDTDAIFLSYAQKLGLDLDRFGQDLNSQEVKDRVTGDYSSGLNLGINATPTFFLNGKKLINPGDQAGFKRMIDEALKENSQ